MLVLNAIMVVTAAIVSFRWLHAAIEVSRTVVTEMPPNSNEEVERLLLELLAEARYEIMMYDDGDPDVGSLYQSREFVDAVKKKIADNPAFRVLCVLNYLSGETLFEQELGQLSTVSIRRRASKPSRIHYKIIDGRKAYVSCHQRKHATRNRKMIDCSKALPRGGRRPLVLRRYLNDFENHAAVAA